MEIKIIDASIERIAGKKPQIKHKENNQIIIMDNESRDKFIDLINNAISKIDIDKIAKMLKTLID